jgi:hypothetical protein
VALKQKRPGQAGAHFPTEVLYHEGNADQVKKLGAKKKKSQNPQPPQNHPERKKRA